MNKNSKQIKKSEKLHQKNYGPDSEAMKKSVYKILDHGDFLLIHLMNSKTKRLNQVLQCKKCPMKFPKRCNLIDHLRMHKDELPFNCNLCGKGFT